MTVANPKTAGVSGTHIAVPAWQLRLGRVLSVLATLFFLLDAAGKLLQIEPVIKGTVELGWPVSSVVPLGVPLVVGALLHALPRTAVLGAIYLTGFPWRCNCHALPYWIAVVQPRAVRRVRGCDHVGRAGAALPAAANGHPDTAALIAIRASALLPLVPGLRFSVCSEVSNGAETVSSSGGRNDCNRCRADIRHTEAGFSNGSRSARQRNRTNDRFRSTNRRPTSLSRALLPGRSGKIQPEPDNYRPQ